MSSQPSQSPKSIIKRCPACGSRVAAEQKVCPICGHEFSGNSTKPVPILAPAPAPTPPPAAEPPTPASTSKLTTQPIRPAKTSTGPQAPLQVDADQSATRPIKPLKQSTQPQSPLPTQQSQFQSQSTSAPRSTTRPITQPTKPASKPVAPPDDRTAIDGRRATGASKAIKPVTMMMNATPRRIPWGLIGVMAVVIAILVAAFWLASNSGFLSTATPRSADGTSVPAGLDATPNTLQSQVPVNAPDAAATSADGQGVADAPTPILVTATPVPPQDYTIVSGDTCGTIAEKFGITLAAFLTANNLSEANCTRIRIGDRLTIPAPEPTAGPSPTMQPLGVPEGDAGAPAATLPPELVYEVQSGDVCGKIVQKFPSVTIDQIIQQNNLDANCNIQVGQKLVLKFSSAQATATGLPQMATTPTPRAGYLAPQLVSPQEGAVLTDTQTTLKLQWLSAGLLKENEYYVVQVQATGAVTAPVWETKATSLDIAQDLVGSAAEQGFTWFVSVKQKIATDPKNNAPIYNDLSLMSQQRQFVWRRSPGTATPVP